LVEPPGEAPLESAIMHQSLSWLRLQEPSHLRRT
jgi:hypothetical protein